MAQTPNQKRAGAMIGHAVFGAVPVVGSGWEGYHAVKNATGSKAVGAAGAVGATFLPVGGGVIAGAVHGYQNHPMSPEALHKHAANFKASANHHTMGTHGR